MKTYGQVAYETHVDTYRDQNNRTWMLPWDKLDEHRRAHWEKVAGAVLLEDDKRNTPDPHNF